MLTLQAIVGRNLCLILILWGPFSRKSAKGVVFRNVKYDVILQVHYFKKFT